MRALLWNIFMRNKIMNVITYIYPLSWNRVGYLNGSCAILQLKQRCCQYTTNEIELISHKKSHSGEGKRG
jgi:hypothetical protein